MFDLPSQDNVDEVIIDSSAAKGIASRRGLGKVRHIEVHQLWLQDKVQKKEVLYLTFIQGLN